MSFIYKKPLPTPEEIADKYPMPAHLLKVKEARDREISRVFTGEDSRLVVIIGPCSAHDIDSVCDYAGRLSALQEKVADKLILIPRIYTNKPRTTGEGYKGMFHQPDHLKETDIVKGIEMIRYLHLKSLSESHLTAADEMLYPNNYPYLEDLLSYVAIGARSVENQQHRLTVSGLDIPVGMKNPTAGDIRVMLDSIFAAQVSHTFVYRRHEVETSGNPLAHGVLRGAVDRNGRNIPNYHFEDLLRVAKMYDDRGLKNPALIVDANHANSSKLFKEQIRISKEVMSSRTYSKAVRDAVKGLMIESYLEEGYQDPNGDRYGCSITDPCLGWEDSERLIQDIADMV